MKEIILAILLCLITAGVLVIGAVVILTIREVSRPLRERDLR